MKVVTHRIIGYRDVYGKPRIFYKSILKLQAASVSKMKVFAAPEFIREPYIFFLFRHAATHQQTC